MTGKYGPGAIEGSEITWTSDEFEVRAIDKLKSYTALILAIEQPATKKTVLALRTEKADKKPETSAVIKSVLDTDKTDKPDVKQNSNAVDAVINAQKGGGTTPPPPKKK